MDHFAENGIMVTVVTLAFNHQNYIRQCIEGILMQKTSFRFELIIHDDASTDGTAQIIKEFETKYPDIVRPIYQTENQSSKGVRIGLEYLYPKAQGKYIALCEGDDYWMDPLKLQKQVAILENQANVTLCCSACGIKTEDSFVIQRRYNQECIVPTQDIIIGGGLWLHTVTFMYRKSLLDNYPSYCRACHVGDYPLILWASLNGSVYYIPEETAVYRYQNVGSWTSNRKSIGIGPLIQGWRSEVDMLRGLDVFSGGKYSATFDTRIKTYLHDALTNHPRDLSLFVNEFREEIKLFTFRQKIHVLCIKMHIEPIYSFLWNRWQSIKRYAHSQ